MRIVRVQKLRLSRGKGLLSPRYSASLRRTPWVVGPSTRALAHISLKRSVEILELQCAQRFPARPADPDSSVFAELCPAPQPEPSQPNVPTEKAK